MMTLRFCHPLFWVVLLVGFLPAAARAEAYATVTALSVPDARGRWTPVQETAAAAMIDGDTRVPLWVKMTLNLGDRIQTEQARVTIRIGRGEHITIGAGGDITLRERSVLQSLGEVYYQVRDLFTVDYGTVQTAVEGTEFSIDGREGPVIVAVTDGVVRVSSADESVRVRRGQVVAVTPGLVPMAPVKLSGASRLATTNKSWVLGRPRLQIGAVGGGGILGGGVGAETRVFAALRLLPALNVVAQTGVAGLGDVRGTRMSDSIGLEAVFGPVSIGAEGQVTMEHWRYPCGGQYAAIHLGAMATGRLTMPVTRRLFIAATGRLGHDGSGVVSSLGIGAGVSL